MISSPSLIQESAAEIWEEGRRSGLDNDDINLCITRMFKEDQPGVWETLKAWYHRDMTRMEWMLCRVVLFLAVFRVIQEVDVVELMIQQFPPAMASRIRFGVTFHGRAITSFLTRGIDLYGGYKKMLF